MTLNELKERLPTCFKKNESNKKTPRVVVIIIIIAIIFLAFGNFDSSGKVKKANNELSKLYDNLITTDEYISKTEQRLKEVLEKINGAGTVAIYISIDNGGEKKLASDRKIKEREGVDTNSTENEYETEENVVFSGHSSGQAPYITQEIFPKPCGVLVVASGANNEKVKLEIYEAVKAIFGLSANRIKVTS